MTTHEIPPFLGKKFEGMPLQPTLGPELQLALQPGVTLVGESWTYEVGLAFAVGGQGRLYRAKREDGVEALIKLPRAAGRIKRSKLTEFGEIARTAFRQEYDSFQGIRSRARSRVPACARFPDWIDRGTHEWQASTTATVTVPFLAFQFIDSPTLHDWRRARGFSFDFEQFLSVAAQIANGMAVIHETGHVHGDLHPKNLIIGKDAEGGEDAVYFIDFGLSSNVVKDLWRRTRPGGAGAFTAPEIRSLKVSDERSDIWSFGAILFFLLKGREPDIEKLSSELQRQEMRRTGSSLDHQKYLIERVLRSTHPRLVRHNPALVDLVCRCLRAEVSQRTESADAVLFDLNLCRQANAVLPAKAQDSLAKIQNSIPGRAGIMGHIANVTLENAAAQFGSIKNGFLTLRGDHEALVRYMCSFLNLLQKGDRYLTLSFPRFWEESNLGTHGRYLGLNRAAALRGVTIKRVLVVDQEEFAVPDSLARRVVRAHRESILDCLLASNDDGTPISVIDREKVLETPGYHTVVHFAEKEEHARLLDESRN